MSDSILTEFVFNAMPVRVVQVTGEPWFVAADVCAVLGLGNVSMALERLDDDEKGVSSIDTLGGAQQMTVINESGLYSLVLGSRKPEAKPFKKWVTAEVLPSIRKTGVYALGQSAIPQTYAQALRAHADAVEAKEQAQKQLALAAPKAEALDRIAQADGDMCITLAAKHIGMPPRKLMAWLEQNRWVYRRAGVGKPAAYQDRIQSGHLTHKVTTLPRDDGSEKVVAQVIVTAKGLAKLAEVAV